MDYLPKRDHNYNTIDSVISSNDIKKEISLNDNELPSPPSRLLNSMQKVPSMSDLLEENSLGE